MGIGLCSCRNWFKKLEIIPVPSLCIFSFMMFVLNNVDEFRTNSSVHGINIRCKIQLHVPSVRLSSVQKGVSYSSVKIVNSLPWNILKLQNDKLIFRSALRRYLLTHVFYSVEEFLSHEWTNIWLHLKFFECVILINDLKISYYITILKINRYISYTQSVTYCTCLSLLWLYFLILVVDQFVTDDKVV